MKTLKQTLALVPVLFLAVACTVGVDGGDLVPKPSPPDLTHKVSGPGLDGTWKSKCDYSYRDSQYRKLIIEIKDQTITRTSESYSTYDCSTLTKRKTYTGIFRFMVDKGSNIFELEYRFDLGNGVTSITGENVKLITNVLYVTDFAVGDALPTIALTKAVAVVAEDTEAADEIVATEVGL